jgi:hypothetical protein
MNDWQPPTETRRWFVQRAAISAWRCDRCVREESVRLGSRVQKVLNDWDRKRDDQVDDLMKKFTEEPLETLEALQRTPEGIVHAINLCKRLDQTLLTHGNWTDPDEHHGAFIRMFGLRETHGDPDCYGDDVDRFGIDDMTMSEALGIVQCSQDLLIHNRQDLAETPEKKRKLANPDRIADQMRSFLQTRIRIMERILPQVDDRLTTRYKTAEMNGLKPHKDDALYQRYEAHHEREVRANIALLMKLEKTGEDLVGLTRAEESRLEAAKSAAATVVIATPTQAEPPKPAFEPTPAEVPNEAKPVSAEPGQLPNEAKVDVPVTPICDREGRVDASDESESPRLAA